MNSLVKKPYFSPPFLFVLNDIWYRMILIWCFFAVCNPLFCLIIFLFFLPTAHRQRIPRFRSATTGSSRIKHIMYIFICWIFSSPSQEIALKLKRALAPVGPWPVGPWPVRPWLVGPWLVPSVSVRKDRQICLLRGVFIRIEKAFFLCYVVAMYQVAKLQCLDYRHCRIHRNCKPNVSVAPECTAWARRGRGVGAAWARRRRGVWARRVRARTLTVQCNCWAHWADGKRQKPL